MRITFANALAGILNAFGPGGQLRAKEQLAAVVDALLQLAGNANISPGNQESADPLNSPFTIYIDPYIGSDRFVGGSYNWFEEPGGATDAAKIAAKLKRLENQRLTCGYSKQRPFRTINRAAIEIVAMTSKNFFTINSEAANVDCPSVELSPGTHIFYNDPGNSSYAIPVTEWPAAGFDPTPNHLIAFNPNSGGIVLPRYATASAPLSLRQSTVRPSYVPAAADEAADYSNRVGILKITSTSYIYGVTFRDQFGATSSHHLLDCFHNASQADLDQLYAKVRTAMGGANNTGNLSNSLAVTRTSEFQTVGPISGNPSEAWDTVRGASPYIYNCSLRTEWGMSGVFWDGARLTGLKSLVAAQFTGISQQRDLSCWEIYRSGAWRAPVNYQELIDSESDDVRMKPRRMSRHITLLNDAFGQLVSVFAIGAGRHHFADSGAQMEFSNSTSNFGGCVAVARGYQSFSETIDSNWNIKRVRVARSVAEQTSNVRKITLGVVSAISGSTVTLQNPLAASSDPATPAVLAKDGFSLPAGTLFWIENPSGPDWRATLSNNAWSSGNATEINISAPAAQAGTGLAIGTDQNGSSLAIGKRCYIRRLIDTRTTSQRRVTLQLSNTTSARVPVRNSILQTRPGVSGGGIDRNLATGGAEVLAVTTTNGIPAEGAGVVLSAEISIRRSCPDETYAPNRFYRVGQTVKHSGKHYTANSTFLSSGMTPDETRWQESYVQQESNYNAEDPPSLEAPTLIFDTDTDTSSDLTANCGINWATIYTESGSVRDQLRSATDYRGALAFLIALGFSSSAAHAALVPRTEASRNLDPASAADFPTAPTGGAASGRANWAIEFRSPSFVQLLGHNFNGVGFWNYSRALPRARRTMSPLNEFNANFAPSEGGRVEVKGINKDGFEVTNQGLINTDTGEVLSVEGIAAETDEAPPTELNDLSVDNLAVTGTLDLVGVSQLDGGESIAMTTADYGTGQLATIAMLLSSKQAATTDEELEQGADKMINLPGLNRLLAERRYISARTDTLIIYVKASAPDRNLDSMFNTPPDSKDAAIPSLARASEYANAIIGGGNQTAEIRIAPGLYDPASVWECSVIFKAWNASLSGMQFPGNNNGSATVENNYFDGSGYGDTVNRVNFAAFKIFLREFTSSANQLHVCSIGRQMLFRHSVFFDGGFHFLGVPELIKLVSVGQIQQSDLLLASLSLPTSAFTGNTTSNTSTLLTTLATVNDRSLIYQGWTSASVIQMEGSASSRAEIYDCVFGPVLPSHKESLGAVRDPYIATNGSVQLRISNIYLRGNVTIDSSQIGTGLTNQLPESGNAHYGTTSVDAPWIWKQFHHTFLGVTINNPNGVYIDRLGGRASNSEGASWYKNNTKYLPNHIHLWNDNGQEPSNNNDGPFLDQLIHAWGSFKVTEAFISVNSELGTDGFVGRFGSNGYNSTKTRGVLLGNIVRLGEERFATVELRDYTRTAGFDGYKARTIFKRAGALRADIPAANPLFSEQPTVTAGSFIVGREYQIVNIGTTDFTAIGATSNTVQTVFTANGTGTGTGTARPAFFGQPSLFGPAGRRYNINISTETQNSTNTAPLELNIGLVSYAAGISSEYGLSINPNVVI